MCIEQYSPLMVWEVTAKWPRNPGEKADLAGRMSCLHHRQRLLVLCWVLAYTYQACVPHPGRGNRISGSKEKQMHAAAESETQEGTMEVQVDPAREGGRRPSGDDVGRQLRRGSLLCSRTATRTRERNDRNHK